MSDILNVKEPVPFDETIVRYQEHIVLPQTGTSFNKLADVSMEISNSDLYTLPSRSYIYLEGRFQDKGATPAKPKHAKISNNGFAFLFEQIRYELNSIEIDRCKNVGITSTMKNYASITPQDEKKLVSAGWNPSDKHTLYDANGNFTASLPLNMFLGFAEDYDKVIDHARQRLVLIRTMEDKNCHHTATAEDVEITIDHISWRIPLVTPGDKEVISFANCR